MESFDIPDSTDWLNTSLPGLSGLENALHCQICKEFFDTPMITSCCHTFCSKCIRTALSSEGKCPACRASDQASKLRNNWQLQEIVATFVETRPTTIKVAREHKEGFEAQKAITESRKRDASHLDTESVGRTTRSKSRRISSQASPVEHHGLDTEPEVDPPYEPEQEAKHDGLVECPLGCGKRMKVEQVYPHLDKCEDEKLAEARAAKAQSVDGPLIRLSELNYGMMKERELARKMKDLGIPNTGQKSLLIKRHSEWVNIWNANCDSSRPRPKKQLLSDLDIWERTQGGSAPMVVNGIMKKDFDGRHWMKKHDNSFEQLIADARKSRENAAQKAKNEQEEQATRARPSQETANDVSVKESQTSLQQTDTPPEHHDTGQQDIEPSSDHAQEQKTAEQPLTESAPNHSSLDIDLSAREQISDHKPEMSHRLPPDMVTLDGTRKMPMFAAPDTQDIQDL